MNNFITDGLPNWIMALAALWGVFEIIRGYFKLRKQQIENTQNISFLNDQVNEARKQTTQFEYHTILMTENNKILEKGIEEILKYFIHSHDVEIQEFEFEKLKRINEIRPIFLFVRGQSNPKGFAINIKNMGGTANSLKVIDTSTNDFLIQKIRTSPIIEKEQSVEIIASSKSNINANLSSVQILIGFQDVDGNQYQQNIIKELNKYRVEPPNKVNLDKGAK